MKILNAEIQALLLFIMNEELNGKMSRMRSRFRQLCAERLKLIEEEKQALLDQYAQKDEAGNFMVETVNGEDQFVVRDMDSYGVEYKTLMLEEWVIDLTEERKDMLLTIKEIVENTTQKLKNETAMQFERYCEIVGQIQY